MFAWERSKRELALNSLYRVWNNKLIYPDFGTFDTDLTVLTGKHGFALRSIIYLNKIYMYEQSHTESWYPILILWNHYIQAQDKYNSMYLQNMQTFLTAAVIKRYFV